MGYRLGVDLGTTFTAAAVANGQPPTVLGLGNRSMQVPSVLFLQPDGAFLVGEAAERRGAVQPDRVVREFKRRIGDHVPMLIAGTPHSPQSLTAQLLRWVVQTATSQLGEPPEVLTITHPAAWGAYRHELLAEVISQADVGPAKTCPEPLAAAVQYASHTRVPQGARIAVYDLGGGTFDVCVLAKTGTGAEAFTILGTPEGIDHLGGIDFDEAIFRQVLDHLGAQARALDLDDPESTAAINRIRRDCVEAKEALSADVEAVIPVTLPGISTTVRLTRPDLETLIRPALARTIEAMDRALRSAQTAPADLHAIVLVGGSSRIPLVTEVLRATFEAPTAVDTHPKHDIALGAVQVHGAPTPPPLRPQAPASVAPIAPGLASASAVPPAPAEARSETHGHVPGPPATPAAPSGPAEPSRPKPSIGARRWNVVAAASAGVGLLIGIVVYASTRSEGQLGGAQESRGSSASATATKPTASTTTTAGAALPQSVPLTDAQMLVPMVHTDGTWDVFLADTASKAPVRRLTDDLESDLVPALSPDRRTAIWVHVSGNGQQTLRVAGAADGKGSRELFDPVPPQCAGKMSRPAWNPRNKDELAIACQDAQNRYGLYLFATDGRLLRAYDVGQAKVGDPAFSPDGSAIAYWAGPASSFDGGEIYSISADGSDTPKRLTRAITTGQDADPTWSPAGGEIAFRRRIADGSTSGNFDIYLMKADGSGAHAVVTGMADDQDPSFAPSGDRLAFKSNRVDAAGDSQQEKPRVWLATKQGTDLELLWRQGQLGEQTAPAWSAR